jgi:hypothetical protein
MRTVSEDKQAHDIVIHFVNEFNNTVGIDKNACLRMLLNKSKFVQPNRLIQTVGKDKFEEFIQQFTTEQLETILTALPQLYIYFVRDRKKISKKELGLIIVAMYAYEKRDELRIIVLTKMKANGQFKSFTKKDLQDMKVYDKIVEDDRKDQTLLVDFE